MFLKQAVIFAIYYLLLGLVPHFIGGYQWSSSEFRSLFSGGFFSGFLFVFSYLGWSGIFKKKFVALSAMVIVFKYAILVFFVYVLTKQPWALMGWFVGGIVTFKIPLFFWAVLMSRKKPVNRVQKTRS